IIMGAPARVIDLSVARSIEDAAQLRTPIGTDAYMAPEQCDPTSLGVPGPASDVWGLGATLHEAISGEKPFAKGDPDSTDPAAVHPQLVARTPVLDKRVPGEVRDIVQA